MNTLTPAVEVKNLTKSYGSVRALKGISFTIAPGEVVAFLGPNGAGKSTSISLMLGMRRPTSGSVALFGKDPRVASHRQRIGAMLQESGVPVTLKVRELVELFARLHDRPMKTSEAIAMAGLTEKANMFLSRLSGGEKQRVYFALALVGNPDILFLDEPTSSLDMESRNKFWEEINHQVKLGKTLILTTHHLEEADALAKRIIVLKQGEIIADDTPAAIKKQVGGKRVSFRAAGLTTDELQRVTGLQDVYLFNDTFTLYTKDPDQLLAKLYSNGTELTDLEVVGARLEDVFVSMTAEVPSAP